MPNLDKVVLAISSAVVLLGIWQLRETNSAVKELKGHVQDLQDSTNETIKGVNELGKEVDQVRSLLRSNGTKISLSDREIKCLRRNVFFEAGVEPIEGKIAVAQVTWNRMKTGRWGHSACEVVHARKQFSWTLQKNKVKSKPSGKLWEESVIAVNKFLLGSRVKGLGSSTHIMLRG